MGVHEKYGAFRKGVNYGKDSPSKMSSDAEWDQTKQQKKILDHYFALFKGFSDFKGF